MTQLEGSVLYCVKLDDGRVQRRHIDQLCSGIAVNSSSDLAEGLVPTDDQQNDSDTVTKPWEPPLEIQERSTDTPETEQSPVPQPESDELTTYTRANC